MNLDKQIKVLQTLVFISLAGFVFSCAKQVALTGGPKDTDPPVVLEMRPENATVNFDYGSIRIFFDEFIKFNNLNQKLIVSPPISPEPDIRIRGRSIQIDIETDSLLSNTTYSLNFNDAIEDITEGNALHSFIYAFSTGELIDSLKVSGKVLDAYTRKPVEDAFVLLHSNLNDSAFRTLPPKYITKVNKNGEFEIPFVKEDKYKIYALIDANFNFKFDQAEEEIAFLDSAIYADIVINEVTDIDSLTDIDGNDSIVKNTYTVHQFVPDNIKLFLFQEDIKRQYFTDRKRISKNQIQIIFNRTQYNDFNVFVEDDDNALILHNDNPDTINIWLQNKELIESDTLFIYADYYCMLKPDSLITDTIRIASRVKAPDIDSVLSLSAPSTKKPYKKFNIAFDKPLKSFSSKKITLEKLVDTIYSTQELIVKKDSLNPLNLFFIADFIEGSNYRIILNDSAVKSIYNTFNITDSINFHIDETENYGNFKLDIKYDKPDSYFIVQLTKNDNIIYEDYVKDNTADFKFIKPDNYNIKLIIDKNKNGRWDTGNFKNNIQPEPVLYYPGEIDIRPNWNKEIQWDISNNNSD